MIISVVNQKGGTGKTTLSVNLAASFSGEGSEVLLIDADPQHSALSWKADRPEGLPRINALHLPAKNLFEEANNLRSKYEIIIIDGGGRVTATARAAVAVADFIVIPTLPGKFDILSTKGFIDTVISEVQSYKPNVSGGIMINQVRAGTSISKAAIQHIENFKYPVFGAKLSLYVAYTEAAAAGMSVIEYNKNSKAALEMLAFFEELKGAL